MNQRIQENLLTNIREYRKVKNRNSKPLIYLLNFNPEKDDILMNLEEEFRPIYESAEDAMDRKKKEEKELEKKDYGKQIQNYFEEVRMKRKNKIEDDKTKETEVKKKGRKIKEKIGRKKEFRKNHVRKRSLS